MLRVGLTGGIGSGKSTVLQVLAQQGAFTVDADQISRALTAPAGAAMPAIAQQFGDGFVRADGGLDRARMREHVYAHPPARRQLEHIIHPLVTAECVRQAAAAAVAGAPCIVFDVPLLVESGRWRRQVDRVLVIDCSEETQVARVVARNGLDAGAVRAIIAAQATRAQRLSVADAVICNDGLQLAELQAVVREVARTFGL